LRLWVSSLHPLMLEADLQRSIISVARDAGFLVYATYRSQRSEPGFPDLVMVKPPRVIFAEIKTEKGRLSTGRMNKANTRWLPGQDDWLEALSHCIGVEYYLWRPGDVENAYAIIMRG
jgi:hypothetical protein